MTRRLAFLTALILLGGAASARAAHLAVFTDPLYVDEGASGEPVLLQRCLADSLGHRLKPFQGTSGTAWSAVLSDVDALVIPELEDARSLADSLAPDALAALRDFIQTRGKGLVICGDFAMGTPSRSARLLNTAFGFSLQSAGESFLDATIDSTAAAGTPFAIGMGFRNLPYANGTYEVRTSSLPAGARNLYPVTADSTAAFAATSGSGRIVYLAYDWFETVPPQPQINLLGSAVIHAANLAGLRVAFLADSSFVDHDQESLRLRANLVSLGHEVTDLLGVDTATWNAALQRSDVLVIPEMETGSVFAAMSAETRTVLQRFIMSGGGLVVSGDPSGRMRELVNGLFGSAIAAGGVGLATLNAGAAAGTPFEFGPRTLPQSNGTYGITTASLPAGAAALYTTGANTTLFRMTRGFGHIVFLGFDYFEFDPAPYAWRTAVDHAVRYASPPDLRVAAAPVAAGATAQVTCDLSGFAGLSISNLRFRQGGDATFLTVPLTQTAPAEWTGTIPGSSVTDKGVQFILDFSDGTRAGNSPILADGAHTHNLPVTLTNAAVASLGAGGYTLRGVSMQAASTSPEAVFDELGAYDIKKWRYGTFNGSGYSEPGGGARNAVPGQGFWIIAKDGAEIAASGTTTNLGAPVEIALAPGFNQIANPFNFPVSFASIIRPADVEANLIGFDGSGYVNGVTTLQPGQGYWIRNSAASSRTIGIPALGAGVAPAPPAFPAADVAPPLLALRVDASAGTFTDRGNMLGLRDDASPGRDAFDLSEPPPAPEGWVRASFATAEDGEFFQDWRPSGSEGDTWELTFASDQSGEPFAIRITPERALPDGWDVAVFEGAREVPLGPDRTIAGTVGYTTAPRRFTVSVGSASYLGAVRSDAIRSVTDFALGAPFPNPAYASAGVSVDLALPQAVGNVSMQVYDVNGRLVRTLLSGPVGAGVQRVAWDGRDEAGGRAAAGVYFVKTRAAGFSAAKKVVLLP